MFLFCPYHYFIGLIKDGYKNNIMTQYNQIPYGVPVDQYDPTPKIPQLLAPHLYPQAGSIPSQPGYYSSTYVPLSMTVHAPSEGTPCPRCCKDTGIIPRKSIGTVAVLWCLVTLTCGFCLVPLLSDGCKDTELVCPNCNTVKSIVQASCF